MTGFVLQLNIKIVSLEESQCCVYLNKLDLDAFSETFLDIACRYFRKINNSIPLHIIKLGYHSI